MTDTPATAPARPTWSDTDALHSAIAEAVSLHCTLDDTGSVVIDDPRTIAAAAATAVRAHPYVLTHPSQDPANPGHAQISSACHPSVRRSFAERLRMLADHYDKPIGEEAP